MAYREWAYSLEGSRKRWTQKRHRHARQMVRHCQANGGAPPGIIRALELALWEIERVNPKVLPKYRRIQLGLEE